MHILAIDDEPVVHEIMAVMLARQGERDVTYANSGAEALDIIRRSAVPFELFLIDIEMPGMSGIECVAAIRTLRDYQSTPITMVTSVTQREAVDAAFAAGATDYMTKPLDKLEFKARIGVMQHMNAERQKNETLVGAIHNNANTERKIDFDAPVDLPSVDFLIELPVMRNYLAALGPVERVAMSALSFHVENLPTIYARSDNGLFIDVLENIATVIFSSLRPKVAMMSYVGGGYFVCVMNKSASVDLGELLSHVEDNKIRSGDFYIHNALPQPVFRCGQLVRFGVFGRKSADQVIDAAIGSASQQTPANKRRLIA